LPKPLKKNTFKKQYGFSLIETLIAVSILMIAIAGPLSLVQAGLFSSIHQRNQVIASYLAQEAVEYIKNIRDTNSYLQWTNPVDWLEGPDGASLPATCSDTIGCYVDPHGNLGGSNPYIQTATSKTLFQNFNTEGIFVYYSYNNSGTATTYKRTVRMKSISANEAVVSVTVEWMDNLIARSYTVKENIYNYEQP
jgi:type II secretory pathway pseudopilin PulG